MKRFTLSLAALVTFFAAPVHAQEADQSESDPALVYLAEKKEAWIAVAAEWFVPIVGHAYAGDTKRGLLPAAVTVAGLGLVVAGVDQSLDGLFTDDNEGQALAIVGLTAIVGGRIWGIVSAGKTAGDTNRALRERLGLDAEGLSLAPVITPLGGARFGVGIAVRH